MYLYESNFALGSGNCCKNALRGSGFFQRNNDRNMSIASFCLAFHTQIITWHLKVFQSVKNILQCLLEHIVIISLVQCSIVGVCTLVG